MQSEQLRLGEGKKRPQHRQRGRRDSVADSELSPILPLGPPAPLTGHLEKPVPGAAAAAAGRLSAVWVTASVQTQTHMHLEHQGSGLRVGGGRDGAQLQGRTLWLLIPLPGRGRRHPRGRLAEHQEAREITAPAPSPNHRPASQGRRGSEFTAWAGFGKSDPMVLEQGAQFSGNGGTTDPGESPGRASPWPRRWRLCAGVWSSTLTLLL